NELREFLLKAALRTSRHLSQLFSILRNPIEMKIRDSAITSSIIVLLMLLCFDSATAQETGISRGRRVSNSGAEATIMVNEEFLNSFLTAIFDNLREPSMPSTAGGAQPTRECAGEVPLTREVGGVRTATPFENK